MKPRLPHVHVTRRYEEGGKVYEEPVTPPVCDFCFDIGPKWDYPCEDFELPLDFGSSGGWAACDPCSELIETGDVMGLVERMDWAGSHTPGSRDIAHRIAIGFLQHRTGPREAFG